ncbi:fibroblast growth factor receptor 4-like isoform X2 [Dendronephthya gigantea]|uniref:fibroblast growth factor receptor 4-like isoform X2 n=1 Tax=Dendronephthya gigantea TaxID=151771 RepID=UPI00106CDD6B|nr:fibroblast growth factor receptor 4-like isoform X2 [Dendronephthya gigantea]
MIQKDRQNMLIFFILTTLVMFHYADTKCSQKLNQWKSANPIDQSLYLGEWIVFDCQLDNNLTNVSLWQTNIIGKLKKRISNGKKIRKFGGQYFNVTNLSISDQGVYECRACGQTNNIKGDVQLFDKNHGVAFQRPNITNKIYKAIEYGTMVRLVCTVIGHYTLDWYKDGSSKHLSYMTIQELVKIAALTIESFTESDDGVYSCKAQRTSVLWEAEDRIYLNAEEVKPVVYRDKTQYRKRRVDQDSPLYLKCEVSQSNPKPEWEWFECVNNLFNCGNDSQRWFPLKEESPRSNSSLVIKKQEFQYVSYRCIARNEMGEDSFTWNFVFDERGISYMKTTINEKIPKYETAGINITVMCECNGSVMMEWTKDGHKLPAVDATSSERSNITRKILMIKNFSKTDEGRYECRVKHSKYNWTNFDYVNLSMKVSPIIKASENKDDKLSQHAFRKGLKLHCYMIEKGIPRANLVWEKCICDALCSQCTHWSKLQNTAIHIVNLFRRKSILTIQSQTSERVNYRCKAENLVGKDERLWTIWRKGVTDLTSKSTDAYVAIIVSIATAMFALLFIIAVVLYKRKKRYGKLYIFTNPPLPDYIERIDGTQLLVEQTKKLPYLDEWEFPRERVFIGYGAFGQVCLAKVIGISAFNPRRALNGESRWTFFTKMVNRNRYPYLNCPIITETAVKMLNDNWNVGDLEDLLSELKILIHVGKHKNVVNILAACTNGHRSKTWIIMEYCPYGNLSEFLRSRRELYKAEWLKLTSDFNSKLSISDLVAIAVQVANGMEFLISRKCIHRDLAARNILMGENFVPKIADFGLARNIYKGGVYLKKKSGLVPVKWMSVEALRDRVFSEKSDVWSFGIVLWEMFTLGGSPYPGIHSVDICEYLCNGNRMESPLYCPNEIYDLMTCSWNADPFQRPGFKMVGEMLNKILSSMQETIVLHPLEIE